jgi:hypothetical protein
MEHRAPTNQLRATLPFGVRYTKELIWSNCQQVDAAQPDWLNAIAHYFN